jgi:hypothetical protein
MGAMADDDAPRPIMAQAALARYPGGKFPFLWVDNLAPVTAPGTAGDQINVITAMTLQDGSPLDSAGQSFVWDLYLVTPPGWREHAREYGCVILLVGSGLHLTDTARLREHAAACPRAGLLTSALVAYTETVSARP